MVRNGDVPPERDKLFSDDAKCNRISRTNLLRKDIAMIRRALLYVLQHMKSYLWEVFVNRLLGSRIIPLVLRNSFYKLIGVRFTAGVFQSVIHAGCYLSGSKLIIGQGSYINKQCLIDAQHASITIGDNVGIGYRVQILTTSHEYSSPVKRTGRVNGSDVSIGNGTWICAGATICPGVKIGGGIVAAGSVVTSDIDNNTMCAGVPARIIRRLNDE